MVPVRPRARIGNVPDLIPDIERRELQGERLAVEWHTALQRAETMALPFK
jgi:hypothetical protein